MTPTKSLADPEKAAMIWGAIAVLQALWAAILDSVLKICFEISGVKKLGLSHLEAKCECGKSKYTLRLSAPREAIFQKY